ncbi:unnamed protein product [Allacma fusca]|uniref:Uncharacterized protein n=1 Tax=Allacma fusca TaxID=39272 RepID=A0A8J2NXE3_9HEXA|nr:unnamed protein product [Allacma fusca]
MYVIRLCAIEHGEKKYFVTPTVLRLQFRYPSPRLFGISHCNIRTLSSIISKVCLEVRQFSKILPVLCQRSVTRHQQSLATGSKNRSYYCELLIVTWITDEGKFTGISFSNSLC